MLTVFDRFIKRNGLYDSFLYNIEHFSGSYWHLMMLGKYKCPLDRYNDIKTYNDPFSYAFSWNETPEGFKFWEKMSEKYNRCTKKYLYL